MTIRKVPTTQIEIRVEQWPGQTFLLWLPESVGQLWGNWMAESAHQDFTEIPGGGLRWESTAGSEARMVAALHPRAESLLLEVGVRNLTDRDLKNVVAQSCFHLSAAPNFACDDFSRIHIRTAGQWTSLDQLAPTVGLPMYYREGFLESGRQDSWRGHFRKHNQKHRVDHPLMVCTSKKGRFAIGTASEDFQCVFHNRMPYLRCIHSQQAPVSVLAPQDEVAFRQVIYFVDGGIAECERAFRKDIDEGEFRPARD